MFDPLLLMVLFVLQVHKTSSQFGLYYTSEENTNMPYYDCLLYDATSFSLETEFTERYTRRNSQLIPFCIRSSNSLANISMNTDEYVTHGTPILFEILKEKNIKSEDLFFLSTPIEVIERYQMFLENSTSSSSFEIFYNCSKPWFGTHCQYSFNSELSFDSIVFGHSWNLLHMYRLKNKLGTCYKFLDCYRGPFPSCLDWREICDGKIDCLNGGQDEIGCEALQFTECKQDEYRCGSGFCIPKEFFNDDHISPDCVDRSDESYSNIEMVDSGVIDCSKDLSFRCEETKCRDERTLSCNDGQCSRLKCSSERDIQLEIAKLSYQANTHLSINCWRSLICLTLIDGDREELFNDIECGHRYENEDVLRRNCTSLFFFPRLPILFGHIYLVYANNLTNQYMYDILLPHYICYNQELCDGLPANMIINEYTCRSFSDFDMGPIDQLEIRFFKYLSRYFLKCSAEMTKNGSCSKSKPYRCANSSKCIALNRLMDGFIDCFEGDDEKVVDSCSLSDIDYRFRCYSENKCIPMIASSSNRPICVGREDGNQLSSIVELEEPYLSFNILCDGFIDHKNIDSLNKTDEMDCEDWKCNNIYTRCNGHWNCPNAVDEVDCIYNPCRPSGHSCLLPQTHDFICLNLSQINDGSIDCLGAFDEIDACRLTSQQRQHNTYRCFNETACVGIEEICRRSTKSCSSGYDRELWCEKYYNTSISSLNYIDHRSSFNFDYKFYKLLINDRFKYSYKPLFTLNNHGVYPDTIEIIGEDFTTATDIAMILNSTLARPNIFSHSTTIDSDLHCNRGVPVYVNNFTQMACLCSPAYFGPKCEYQSQRVSLTLQFRSAELRKVFAIVIILMDETFNIHSWEQMEYLSVRDCQRKFNIYLLYLTQPKNVNQTYFVRIDTYDTAELKHYMSMIYPIPFTFLPVHRLSLRVDIPILKDAVKIRSCPLKCSYGQCRKFLNSDQYFCQCYNGYSGILCTKRNECDCSSDSLCIGFVNNRSICVCPLDKFGPRCYLKRTACAANSCSNTSLCIPGGEKYSKNKYFCVCFEGYAGTTCHSRETRIDFHFGPTVPIPQTMFAHFLYAFTEPNYINGAFNNDLIQNTIIVKLKPLERSTFAYYGGKFHLIFVEYHHQQYYLALLQHNNSLSLQISTTIIPEHRCLSIRDVLPIHLQTLPRWSRAKHYQIPCQKYPTLKCFYDSDYFMCLCDKEHFANCFKFNYHPVYNCSGYNHCENDGQCYSNDNMCPTSSSCFCKECHYGSQCQFTTKHFGLSLDDIFGYSIWPNVTFTRQPMLSKLLRLLR